MRLKHVVSTSIRSLMLISLLANTSAFLVACSNNAFPEEGLGEGRYRVGYDIPAGEYVLVAIDIDMTSWQLLSQANDKDSYEIASDMGLPRSIVTVRDNEVLIVNSGVLYAFNDAQKSTDKVTKTEGMYKVGFDLSPGEYIIKQTGPYAYFKVSPDSRHNSLTITASGRVEGQIYLTVKAGQYLWLSACEAIIPITEKGIGQAKQQNYNYQPGKALPAGMYKIGVDIPSGEYVALSPDDIWIMVASDSTGENESIIGVVSCRNHAYIDVAEGQYMSLEGCQLYYLEDAPKFEFEGFLPEGIYKAGTDLPAGEYVLVSPENDFITCYMYLSAIPDYDAFKYLVYIQGRSIVTVEEGEYISIKQAVLYTFDTAPKIELTGTLGPGMYKVGVDLPSGEYLIRSIDSLASCAIKSDSRHGYGSTEYFEYVDAEVSVTVAEGQYLELNGCELVF